MRSALGILLLSLSLSMAPRLSWSQEVPATATPTAVAGNTFRCPNQATITINTTNLRVVKCPLTQATTFAKTDGSKTDQQTFVIEACSATSQTVKWDAEFSDKLFGIPLPSKTRGNNLCERWGFVYHEAPRSTWDFTATTPPAEK